MTYYDRTLPYGVGVYLHAASQRYRRFVATVEAVAQPQTESPTITGFDVMCERCKGMGKVISPWRATLGELQTCPRCRGSRIGQYWRWRRGWTLRT